MKLLRVGELGKESLAALDNNNKIRDLSNLFDDLSPDTFNNVYLEKIKRIDLSKHKEISLQIRIGPFIKNAKNFLCVGKNFIKHINELNSTKPKNPMIFSKANCISGPYDDIIIPKASKKVDWECEIGVCLKEEVYQIKENESDKYIGGYFLANDVSASLAVAAKGLLRSARSCGLRNCADLTRGRDVERGGGGEDQEEGARDLRGVHRELLVGRGRGGAGQRRGERRP